MQTLELKIPPPLVALLIALAMWGISLVSRRPIDVSTLARVVLAAALALAGGAVSVSGVLAFRRAKTTINPMKPQNTSSLVDSGIYRFTRNPMYLGLAIVLVAWALFLFSPWALVGPLAFVLYINRFQIAPEERALAALFGADFTTYTSKVRRWL
jgi:protein-S-isoprenylcysteine O-methyltransferase Ste14